MTKRYFDFAQYDKRHFDSLLLAQYDGMVVILERSEESRFIQALNSDLLYVGVKKKNKNCYNLDMKKVKDIDDIIMILEQNKETIHKYGARRLGVFGSFLSGKQTEDSDIDIIVEFCPGKKTFRNFIKLSYFLENALARRIELITIESISPYLKKYILQEVEYVKVA